MDFKSLLLEENGYGNETLFLRAMENLGLVEVGRVEKKFSNFTANPRFGTEGQTESKKKDDDERVFKNF